MVVIEVYYGWGGIGWVVLWVVGSRIKVGVVGVVVVLVVVIVIEVFVFENIKFEDFKMR